MVSITQPNGEAMSKPALQLGLSNDQVIEKAAIDLPQLPDRSVRKISERAIALCKANLPRFGQPGAILVSGDMIVIHGEEILLAARELGWTHINIVRMPDLNGNERRVLTLALAKLPLLSSWDDEALRIEFSELSALDLDFEVEDLTGFTIGEIDVVLHPKDDTTKDDPADEVPQPLPGGESVSRAGDLWLLGKHRLLCGNALLPEDYTRLMGNKRARMIFSDAPYNIFVENNVSGLGKIKHKDFAMASGEMNFDEFKNFLKTFVSHSIAHAVDGALLYLFMDRRHLEELFLAGRETGLKIVDLCIWEKKTGGMGSFYRSQHEPCVIFRVGKADHLNCIELGRHGRYRTNVWSHPGLGSFGRDRDESLAMHPTVKPVNLLAEAIKDCTRRGDIVLDPFAGSASTIIAAEKTRRIAYAIELDATYVDTGLRRWEKFSGVKAVHEGSGASFDEIRQQRNPASGGLRTQR